MSFIYPQFLWALAVLSIPLIIHLFNFRRYQTIYFSNTWFLQSLQKNSRAINRLRQFFIMLARMLALAALVFAFAQPYLPKGENAVGQTQRAVIYVDNSLSMSAAGTESNLLNKARQKAVEIARSLPENVEIQVLTNTFKSSSQQFYQPEAAVDQIDRIQNSYRFRTSGEILERVRGALDDYQLDSNNRLQVYLLSDFPGNAYKDWKKTPDFWDVNAIPLRSLQKVNNLAIDSVWLSTPVLIKELPQTINVKIQNYSEESFEQIPLELLVEGQRRAYQSVDIPANGFKVQEFEFYPSGPRLQQAKIELQHGELSFDNTMHLAFAINQRKKVLITGTDPHAGKLRKLLKDSTFEITVQQSSELDYQKLRAQDLVIVNGLPQLSEGLNTSLQEVLKNGHNVFFIPEPGDNRALSETLEALNAGNLGNRQEDSLRAAEINYDDPYFANVFLEKVEQPSLPRIMGYYSLELPQSYPLISLENDEPLIARQKSGNGDIFVSAAVLGDSSTSLWSHPIARPIFMNAALYSGIYSPLYLQAGRSGTYQEVRQKVGGDKPLRLAIGEKKVIPPQRKDGDIVKIFLPPQETPPGIYPVEYESEKIGQVAVNVDSRESATRYLSDAELKGLFDLSGSSVYSADNEQLGYQIRTELTGVRLWRWFILGALVFLLSEILLIKLWR